MLGSYLFNNSDMHSAIQRWQADLREEILRYSADALLSASVDTLVEYFVADFTMQAIELDTDRITVSQHEAEIDVSQNFRYAVFDRDRPAMRRGTRFRFHVPFQGDPGLFRLRPATFTIVSASVSGEELTFDVTQLVPDPAMARRQFEDELANIQHMLGVQRGQIDAYHNQLPSSARTLIEERRSKLLADRAAVAAIGYPMRRRDDATTYASSSVIRRPKIAATRTRRPPGGTQPFVPEPVLTDEDFERVVEVVRSMTTVMERSPSAFIRSTEETLRDHILVQLNGHFEGKALGEAFNASGKTDILLRDGDRNLLICECKFWKGPKSLTASVDQLMSYLTWRDASGLVIVFNRSTRMSTVLKVIEEGIPKLDLYRRGFTQSSETEFNAVLVRADDPDREVRLKVMVMDVPNTSATPRSREPSTT
jgi:hypothetical protein